MLGLLRIDLAKDGKDISLFEIHVRSQRGLEAFPFRVDVRPRAGAIRFEQALVDQLEPRVLRAEQRRRGC
jgi:hypothetical protein